MTKLFKVKGTDGDKELTIVGPENFHLDIRIDFDDVYHARVEREARKLCRILNSHWDDETLAQLQKSQRVLPRDSKAWDISDYG
jgi:hypothetical protein